MASIPTNLARVSGQLKTDVFLSNLNRTNTSLLNTQNQLATGLRVNRPSDDPSVVGGIMNLNKKINEYDQNIFNYNQANSVISNTDAAISDIMSVLRDAYTLGQEQVDKGAMFRTPQEVIGLIDEMRIIANREYQDIYLFAGNKSDTPPFIEHLGKMQYVGGRDDLTTDLGWLTGLGVNTNGNDAMGAMSSRVTGSVDLDPWATSATHLDDVRGTRNMGIAPGIIIVDVDSVETEVDLIDAETMDDVILRINAVINSQIGGLGGVSIEEDGFSLFATNGHSVTISDIGMGATAIDLGLNISVTAPPIGTNTVYGDDIDPKLTKFTRLADLGVAVDLALGTGLKITNGGITRDIDLSGVETIEDLMNIITAADVGVRVEINRDNSGIDIINELSGSVMSIGEINGGTTAADLGVRSLDTTTRLADFNHGKGVRTLQGQTDLEIHLHDGTQIDVDLDGTITVQDVIDAINAAGAGNLTAALVTDGNGIELTDNTAGGDSFSVISPGGFAAADLGINKTVPSTSNTISGDDTATVRTESVFTHLDMLYSGLIDGSDIQASRLIINEALAGIKEDMDNLSAIQMGARSLRVTSAIELTQEQQLTAHDLLSNMQDVDYAAAVSQFTALEQQLEANLLMGQILQQMTLLDFLR